MKSPAPAVLFAPGAGAPSSSPWMKSWQQRLATLRVNGAPIRDVVAFDFPYQQQGRKAPDRQAVLLAAHLAAVRDLAASSPGAPVILIGKSMGGRIGCHVAADHPADVAAVVCLGYPLKSGGTGALRDEVLVRLRTPILFVQGTRDPLCPLEMLASTRKRMTARNELHVVEGGNHSLELPAKERARQAESDAGVLESITTFLEAALR
jgi:predicted alpha/beta-hydrolase family hydrolase